ncbi:hypothetical protein V1294_006965 [Bradyrhizobium sp. AZCC 1678]|uniref:Tc toxin subunit A-related protein n=1 Tax=Bradyrhizobium sp. AZCC 1678 TaxID=3117030 RepID=UPI002FF428EA
MPTGPKTPNIAGKPAKPPIPLAVTPPPREPDAYLEHVLALTNRRAELRTLAAAELTQLPQERRGRERRLSPGVRRRLYLKALRTWHDYASARLQELESGRTGSDTDAQPIPPAREPYTAKLKRRLVVALSKNSARMAILEGAQRRWHAAAKAARDGIRLRRETAREVLGTPLRPDARLHLIAAQATFMLEGNSPRLRADLKDAAARMPESKGLHYWLARYEVMVGHYPAALEAANKARDYPPVRHVLMPLLDPESADAPWLSWPCNFYTYRYTLADPDALRGMQQVLSALANNSEVVTTWVSLGIPQVVLDDLKERAIDGGKALASLLLWNQGNADMEHSKYASAVRNYEDCQRAIVDYFVSRYDSLDLSLPSPPDESGSDITPAQQLDNALQALASELIRFAPLTRNIWTFFRERYMTVTLEELYKHDWRRPNVVPLAYEFATPLPNYGEATDFATALARLLIQMSILKSLQTSGEKVEEKIDAPLLAIALVFCPLAIAEANRLRRHFDKAISQCNGMLRRHSQFGILSEVIEKPFVKILKAQILRDKADAQYKSRALANSPATNPDGSLKYQGLEAAETYQGVLVNFEDQGQYVNRVNAGLATMQTELSDLMQRTFHPIAVAEARPGSLPPMTDADREAFALVGKKLTIETLVPRKGLYPDPDRRTRPHESLLRFEPPAQGGETPTTLLETNPVIYALIIEARARLLQMESGLNYLGYRDDFVPPWRFQFLLDRARYFVEHAKNAQREYLNFLGNAEREEFQELTVAQSVEMEKCNVRTETARVEQVKAELEAAKESAELSSMAADHAQTRLDRYQKFDEYADSLFGTTGPDPLEFLSDIANNIPGLNAVLTGVGDLFTGGAISNRKQQLLADAQRGVEEQNLELAVAEADQAATVADRQLAAAEVGVMVAGMQRAAAVLRHEFAVQSLSFLRNRTLNAELWYRLSAAIRHVADTYLRYGIETAFLAEQAYEFELDKRINVIRFDYDVSDLGDMLAGDFLLRDLDTLENDLIIGQQQRQQQVRYVLSLAREFPDALQELRDIGHTTFSLRLEQLERRFPGLFNLRVSSVEVMPIALMDGTRFSLELTQLGSGYVRLKSQADAQTGDEILSLAETLAADWLIGLQTQWPVKARVTGPETAVFSGLTRQDLVGLPSFFISNQRGAFEGLAGASSWRVDLSMRENRIVPGTLADLLVTFTLAGYYDSALRQAIETAPRKISATDTWLSAHLTFPDAFYAFNRAGRMDWDVTPDVLALRGSPGELRNLAVVMSPSAKRPALGRLMCSYPVELEVQVDGSIRVVTILPSVTLTTSGLELAAQLNTPSGAVVTLDFGDGSGIQDSSALPHRYARPGRYELTLRIAHNSRLAEYRATIVVSRQHPVLPPLIVIPDLQTSIDAGKLKLQPSAQVAAGEPPPFVTWRVDGVAADAAPGPVTFTLDIPPAGEAPKRHVLRFLAARQLQGRFYSRQRYVPNVNITVDGLRVASNRTFDPQTGEETTTALNAFGQHVFASGTLAPADTWTFDLPLDINPAVVSVSTADVLQYDLGELGDALLALEYPVHDV